MAILRFEYIVWGLWAVYAVLIRLTGKRIVDFMFAIIELFVANVTVEALRANID